MHKLSATCTCRLGMLWSLDCEENCISCTMANIGAAMTPAAFPYPQPAGCGKKEGTAAGAVRLRGGFGTLCDPIHSGSPEVLHGGSWGGICTDQLAETQAEDNLVAGVVCRQLGFPHGTRIDAVTTLPSPSAATGETTEQFWLSSVECEGQERRLIDCDLGQGFLKQGAQCPSHHPHRLHIACRNFPLVEVLEAMTTPEAGADPCCM